MILIYLESIEPSKAISQCRFQAGNFIILKVHFSNFRENNLNGLCWGDQVTGPSFPWDVQGASKDHESAETTRTAKIQDPDDLYVDMF